MKATLTITAEVDHIQGLLEKMDYVSEMIVNGYETFVEPECEWSLIEEEGESPCN